MTLIELKTMRIFYTTLVTIAVLFLAGCKDSFVSKTWNQKMTVTVEIDGQTYVGSSIQRIQMNYNAELGPYPNPRLESVRWSNEAVAIDLREHGYLFVLWGRGYRYPERYSYSYKTEYSKGPPRLTDRDEKNVHARAKAYRKYLEALARPGNRSYLRRYPEFVVFEDMTDPKTIKSFRATEDFYAPKYHNAKAFKDFYGSSAKVVSVVVENTEEPLKLGQIDEIFGTDFFTEWHNEARGERRTPSHGATKTPGLCGALPSEYYKQNKLYCGTTRSDFEFDRLGLKNPPVQHPTL